MKSFNQLKKNLKQDFTGLKKTKISILGDSATQLLNYALKGIGYDYGFDADIFEADFNQIELQVFSPDSEYYNHDAQYTLIFFSTHKLLKSFYKLQKEERKNFADNRLNQFKEIFSIVNSRAKTQLICYNFNEIDDHVFGSYSNKTDDSFLYQVRKLNYKLSELSTQISNLHISDISSIQNQFGKEKFFQPSVYVNSDIVIGLDVLPYVAKSTFDIISALEGKIKKCIILDLDNTLWGGIIGDDGIENIQIGGLGIGKAFTEFQYWLKELKNRGVILAVCSKNNEDVAKVPFEKHPEMILRLDDISVFVANWENKASNIRHIQQVLNIGFDSMVFLDDNPFERNMVRENIVGIAVPELPEDPALYLEYLYILNLFETVGISKEDGERTKQYQTEAKRMEYQKSFVDEDDFLKNLNMNSIVEGFNSYNTPRVSQLSQRSNQFNLRTVRYSESEIKEMGNKTNIHPFAFHLEDKFGDHGLISLVVMKEATKESLFIETWLMSCRVLKRGMENFVLNTIVQHAIENKYKKIIGEYIPSSKNEMVKNHYQDLGFVSRNGMWELLLDSYQFKKTFIQKKTNHVERNHIATSN